MGYSDGYDEGYAAGGGPTEHFGAVGFTGTGTFSADGDVAVGAAVTFAGAGSFTARAVLPIYALASFSGTSSFLSIARFTGTDYSLLVVDKDGGVYGEVEDARIGSVTFELNGTGGLDFTIPTTHPDAALIQPGREVQLYRGDQLLFWGPIVRHQIGLDEASYQCAGLLWYFEHRYMGRADRVNLLTNGDFEDSEVGWTFNNGVGHTVDLTRKIEGAKSLKLTGGAADHAQYASQVYIHTTQYHPLGDLITVSAWVFIPSADYLGGSLGDIGLAAVHKRGGVTVNDPEASAASLGDDTTKDEWIPLEVVVRGVLEDDTVEVQLYPPHGVANYDLVTATLMESLAGGPGDDITEVMREIVLYAQDQGAFTHGKSDLNIGTSTPGSGEMMDAEWAYQFAEHRNIADALLEFVRRGIVDFDFALTPTTRTFTIYAPRKGHYRSDLPLQLDTTVADFSYSFDGEAAASSVIVLGPGDGPDRPEGAATDPTAFDGLTLEWVESAPDDVTIGQLDAQAAERLRVGINPTVIEATTLPDVDVIGQLQTGDTVPVVISRGPLAINSAYRAVRIAISPHTDQATVTLNVEA